MEQTKGLKVKALGLVFWLLVLSACGAGGASEQAGLVANSPTPEQVFVSSLKGTWSNQDGAFDRLWCSKVGGNWSCAERTPAPPLPGGTFNYVPPKPECQGLATQPGGLGVVGSDFVFDGQRLVNFHLSPTVVYSAGTLSLDPWGTQWGFDYVDESSFVVTFAQGCSLKYVRQQ